MHPKSVLIVAWIAFLGLIQMQVEQKKFTAEVDQVMKMIVNSLYKEKEIFVRELISNGSDALDKLRTLSLRNKTIVPEDWKFNITLRTDKQKRTLEIVDTGIGMTKSELVDNLGTIAKSGTRDFIASIQNNEARDLIGQFGVGFYSVFLVADQVEVTTQSLDREQHVWTCDIRDGHYNIMPGNDTFQGPGTKIVAHVRDGEELDYFDDNVIQDLVKKYSKFVDFPIHFCRNVSRTIPADSEAEVFGSTTGSANTTVWQEEYVHVNNNKPIWLRDPKEVLDEEYDEFYRETFADGRNPLGHIYFTGASERSDFRGLIYVPENPTFYPFTKDDPPDFLSLYVKRVFISNDFRDLFPRYVAFIKGIVDVDDIPLNVSREVLQKTKTLVEIRNTVVSKTLRLLKQMSKNETLYSDFYSRYSGHIKLGLMTESDESRKEMLADLLRYHSSGSEDKSMSLADYVDRMQPNQTEIYFVAGNDINVMKSLPCVENVVKRGYEVIYMAEPQDEYAIQPLGRYKDKVLRNISKEGLKLDDEETVEPSLVEKYEPLVQHMKHLFQETIEKIVISPSLGSYPMTIVSGEYGLSPSMERLVRGNDQDPLTKLFLSQKKVIQLNPNHPLVQELLDKLMCDQKDELNKYLWVLHDTALLQSGYDLRDPSSFVRNVQDMILGKYAGLGSPEHGRSEATIKSEL